mgnify:CR=1 FL=1
MSVLGLRWFTLSWALVWAGVAFHSRATSAFRRAGTTTYLENRPTVLAASVPIGGIAIRCI